MAIAIRSNKNIKGISVNGNETKISLLADDTTLILADIISLRTSLNILSIFYFTSGLKINYDKSEVLQVGKINISFKYHRPFRLQWSQGGIKSLGVYFYNNVNEITRVNLSKKLEEFKYILYKWARFHFTLKGKI